MNPSDHSHSGSAGPLVDLDAVSMTYGDLTVLRRVTLTVRDGESVSVTGASGSGKSTLLGILGLLERPTGGRHHMDGRDVWALSDAAQSRLRGETLGFVFQQFHLLPELTALDNVARPLRLARQSIRDARAEAATMLERVGLAARRHHRPAELSGGEQQRVAIARALIRRPRLLLADEPTGNLPQALWGEILDLFSQLNAQGTAVVIVTHDPLVAAHARRHIRLQDGEVVADSAG